MGHSYGTVLLAILVMLSVSFHHCTCTLPTPNAINFIGVGYDIIKGNPEGGDSSLGGVDPGLKVSRKIMTLSYGNSAVSSDGAYHIPDEIEFTHRSSATETTSYTTFYGTSTYRKKLSTGVEVKDGYRGFVDVAFAASTRFASVSSRTSEHGSVFFASSTVENLGRALYRTDLAEADKYLLEPEFVAAACGLPSTYNEKTYMNFIEEWGTHVVTAVDVGVRTGENYVENRPSFIRFASETVDRSVSASVSLGSLTVDMDVFNSQLNAERSFGSIFTSHRIGDTELTEPIRLTLLAMNEIFDDDFWTGRSDYNNEGLCSSSWDMASARHNVVTALGGYANWLGVQATSSDNPVVIPLSWPDGTYGLLKPAAGCPNHQFTWAEGNRYHDTEDDNSANQQSGSFHVASTYGLNNISYSFCMKTHPQEGSSGHWGWPKGSYCIYKYGACPQGFTEGYVFWDDEDNNNKNSYDGILPDGEYYRNTKVKYCCREDGPVSNRIYLPVDDPFILFPRHSKCQEVHGMSVTIEYFRWDNEDDGNTGSVGGMHPYEGVESRGHSVKLYFCYYQKFTTIMTRRLRSTSIDNPSWPDGTYGLPKPAVGCPNHQFTWAEGSRYHDTEDSNSANRWSSSFNVASTYGRNNMRYYFCMKTHEYEGSSGRWPRGSYCIYKYRACPQGFSEGYVFWDDEDNNNQNSYEGILPDGEYYRNTKVKYCCREDGPVSNRIYLPVDDPFFLFPRHSQCQKVHGMSVTMEYFRWDNEDNRNSDSDGGMHPYEGVENGIHNVKLYFCYYQKA